MKPINGWKKNFALKIFLTPNTIKNEMNLPAASCGVSQGW
jgi:hypothetical protein